MQHSAFGVLVNAGAIPQFQRFSLRLPDSPEIRVSLFWQTKRNYMIEVDGPGNAALLKLLQGIPPFRGSGGALTLMRKWQIFSSPSGWLWCRRSSLSVNLVMARYCNNLKQTVREPMLLLIISRACSHEQTGGFEHKCMLTAVPVQWCCYQSW